MKIKHLLFSVVLLLSFDSVFGQLAMKKQKDGILITEGQANVLFYRTKPVSTNGAGERCNYIHPLWNTDGSILTEDSPSDHPRQRGVYWSWPQVLIGDKRIGNPWELKDFEQKVVEFEFIRKHEGGILLKNEVNWFSNQWQKDGKEVPYIKENTSICVHPMVKKCRRIDFKISLLALADDLRIGGSDDDKGYGGFAVRMVLPDDVCFNGSSGEIKPALTAIKSEGFINISGAMGVKGKKAGIIIWDNSENPDYPQNWILRSKNSMQNVVWPGRETVTLSVSKPLVLKYSMLIYSGKINNKKVKEVMSAE